MAWLACHAIAASAASTGWGTLMSRERRRVFTARPLASASPGCEVTPPTACEPGSGFAFIGGLHGCTRNGAVQHTRSWAMPQGFRPSQGKKVLLLDISNQL